MRWIAMGLLVALCGCSFFTPGADVRQALLAKNNLHWGADGTADIVDETTHNGTTILFESAQEGPGAAITLNDKGVPTVTGASGLFYRKTDPKDAADTYMRLAEMNAAAWASTMQAVLAAMQQNYDYRLQNQAQGSAADAARWDRIMEAIERLTPATQPE